MGHQERREFPGGVDFPEPFVAVPAGDGIEGAERLIEQQDVWVGDQRAHQGDPLAQPP